MKKNTCLLAALMLGPTLGLPAADAATSVQPNIVYILADDMGYADAGFMGSKDLRTPNLDRLAHDGTILSSYYVQPVCSPTRSTLMTGRYPIRTGVYSVVHPHEPWGLKLEERTLAQALRDAGYETAITGKWHLGEFQPAYRPTQRGFDHQYGLWFGMTDYFTHMRGSDIDWHRDDKPCDDKGYSTHLIAKEACRLIREKASGKPLFLYLPFNAVHTPLQVPDSYLAPFGALSGKRKTYAGMMAAMDEAVGQVIAALDETGRRANTLVVFSSDNGGPAPGTITDNGPLRAGKGTIYEGGIRVCACVNWPGRIPAGKTVAEPVQSVDWYPTLVRLAGGALEQPLPLDGKDIWPVLTAGAKTPHDALLLCGTTPARVAVRAGDWKLLVGANDRNAEETADAVDTSHGPRVELYNLAADIGEKNDLAAANPEKVKELRARLDDWMKSAVVSSAVAAPAGDGKPTAKRKGKKSRQN
jgi:arylsulfatase A-like enzyme